MRASDLILGVDDRGCARCAINLDTWVNGNQCSLASCKEELDFEIFKQLNIKPIFTQNTNGTNIRASKCMHVSLLQLKICHVIDRCGNSCATLYCERTNKKTCSGAIPNSTCTTGWLQSRFGTGFYFEVRRCKSCHVLSKTLGYSLPGKGILGAISTVAECCRQMPSHVHNRTQLYANKHTNTGETLDWSWIE